MMQGKDALMNGQSLQMAAASLETSYSAPAAANPADSKSGWKPYGGYDPKNRPAAPAPAPAAAYAPPAQEMAAAYAQAAPAAPAPAAPEKKWQPYGGYDPKNRAAPAAADTNAVMARVSEMMGAPAPAAAAPASSSAPAYAPAAASYEAPAQSFASAGSDPMSSAPAKKWQPYGGYDPKSRGPPASTAVNPAYAPAAA